MSLRTKGHYPFSLKFNRGESFHNPPAHVLLHGLSSFFLSRQDLKCQVWKKTSIMENTKHLPARHSSILGAGGFFPQALPSK
jgi:hypothetical protein